MTASRLLRPGGTLVYSTCTFAPEENEGVIDWLLRKTHGTMKSIAIGPIHVSVYPTVTQWLERTFDHQVTHGLRILPGGEWEGFFIAKLVKGFEKC